MTTHTIDAGQVRTRVLIGGVDYSAQLYGYELSDSHVDQSGLVKTTGKIEFTEGAISIDNWGLPAIPDGATVTIDVLADGAWRRHPRGGLRAIGSSYSELAAKLVLEVGCILSARSFAEVPDVFLSGVTPGSSAGVQTVVNRLLNNGGINGVLNQATGQFSFLDRPQMSGSAIETSGKMLASMGAIAWTDSKERVRTSNLSLDPPTRIWAGHAYELVSFERIKNGQPPTEEIKVTGSYRELHTQKNPVTVGPILEYGPTKWGNTQVQKSTTTTTVIDFGGAVETTETTIRHNAEVVYRAWNPGGNGLVPGSEISTRIRKFDKNDTGYLLSNIEVISKERGLALGPYLDWLYKNDTKSFNATSRYGRIPCEKKEELYTYNSNGFLVRKETIFRNTLCNLLGELGDPNWKMAKTTDLAGLVVFERTIETWEEKLPGQWMAFSETIVAQGRAPQGRTGVVAEIDAHKTQAEYTAAILQAQQLMSLGRNPVNSNSGQSHPPEPERIPAQFRSESAGTESIAHFPTTANDWQPRRSEMQIPYLPDRHVGSPPPTEFCQQYGKLYGGIQQAQWRTLRMTLPLTQWLIDGYSPWAAIDVIRGDTVYTLAISGSSWAGDREQCLVSIDGALLGERVGAVVSGQTIASSGVLQPPYLLQDEDLITISSTIIELIEPQDVYADEFDEVVSSTLIYTVEVDHISTVNSTLIEEVVDDDQYWIWIF